MSDSVRPSRSVSSPSWRTIALIVGATSVGGSGAAASGIFGVKPSGALESKVEEIATDTHQTQTDIALLKNEQKDEREDRKEADHRIEKKLDDVHASLDKISEELRRGRPPRRR